MLPELLHTIRLLRCFVQLFFCFDRYASSMLSSHHHHTCTSGVRAIPQACIASDGSASSITTSVTDGVRRITFLNTEFLYWHVNMSGIMIQHPASSPMQSSTRWRDALSLDQNAMICPLMEYLFCLLILSSTILNVSPVITRSSPCVMPERL